MGIRKIVSFLSPKVLVGRSMIGKGLFAKEKIHEGEVVVDFSTGPGKYLSLAGADELYEKGNDYMIQIDEDSFFVATQESELEDADFINHSCDPNLGMRGILKLVARRDIKQGEELTFDYAMSESSSYEIKCLCGSKKCRKIITGDDWKNPALQQSYKGFFSPYLQRKIDRDLRTTATKPIKAKR